MCIRLIIRNKYIRNYLKQKHLRSAFELLISIFLSFRFDIQNYKLKLKENCSVFLIIYHGSSISIQEYFAWL